MTFRASVERYLGAVAQQYHRGDAREESYYDVLKQLWEELGSQLSSAHATLTVLPRQTEAVDRLVELAKGPKGHDNVTVCAACLFL